jgi:hypothetical protein
VADDDLAYIPFNISGQPAILAASGLDGRRPDNTPELLLEGVGDVAGRIIRAPAWAVGADAGAYPMLTRIARRKTGRLLSL